MARRVLILEEDEWEELLWASPHWRTVRDMGGSQEAWERLMSRADSAPTEEEAVERIGTAIHGYACGCEKPWPLSPNYDELARAALAALGGERGE